MRSATPAIDPAGRTTEPNGYEWTAQNEGALRLTFISEPDRTARDMCGMILIDVADGQAESPGRSSGGQ